MSDESKTSETPDEIEAAGAAKPTPDQDVKNEAGGESAPGEQQPARTVEELTAALAACQDQVLRAAAEIDNMRKRAARDVHDARAYSIASFARDLLSVGDNLARAIDALTPEMREHMGVAGRTLLDGIEITERELIAALGRHGVKPIPVERGTPFDPNLHQAAAQTPSDLPAGEVVDVMQSGWTIGDRVLRAAMVVVSAGPAESSGSNGAASSDAEAES